MMKKLKFVIDPNYRSFFSVPSPKLSPPPFPEIICEHASYWLPIDESKIFIGIWLEGNMMKYDRIWTEDILSNVSCSVFLA